MTLLENVGPPRVVVEMSGDEGDIDIPGLTDGFAIVEGFDDSEETALLLDAAGEGVEVTGTSLRPQFLPGALSRSGCFDRLGNVFGSSRRQIPEGFSGRRVFRTEGLAGFARPAGLQQYILGDFVGGC